MNEYNNTISKNKLEYLEQEYKQKIKKLGFIKTIDDLSNINRLNGIIYNTYNKYNNNYFNSINMNKILINYYNNKNSINNDLNENLYEVIIELYKIEKKINLLIPLFVQIYNNKNICSKLLKTFGEIKSIENSDNNRNLAVYLI